MLQGTQEELRHMQLDGGCQGLRAVLRPRPMPLPANEQTPVVEDGHSDDGQPVIVHVVGGVHHDGVLLLSGNTDIQAARCVGRPQLWKGLETWPSLETPGQLRAAARDGFPDRVLSVPGGHMGVPVWVPPPRLGAGQTPKAFSPSSAPREATGDYKTTVMTFPCPGVSSIPFRMPRRKREHGDVGTISGSSVKMPTPRPSQTPPGLGPGNVHLITALGGSETAPLWTELGSLGVRSSPLGMCSLHLTNCNCADVLKTFPASPPKPTNLGIIEVVSANIEWKK